MLKTRVILVLALNLSIVGAEIIFGFLSNSMALIADAVHNLGDCMGIIIALVAIVYREKRATRQMTWGYIRSEMMAGFINSLTLLVGMGFVVIESVKKLLHPQPVDGAVMVLVATVALLANLLSVFLLRGTGLTGHGHNHDHSHSHETDSRECKEDQDCQGHKGEAGHDLNIRAAYLHLISDAAVSLGVVAGGAAILWFKWAWVDPVLSILFTGFILKESVSVLRATFLSLMDAGHEDLGKVETAIMQHPEILSIHDVHITRPSSRDLVFSAHLVLKEDRPLAEIDALLDVLRKELADLGVTHTLFQPESASFHGNDPFCCTH